MVEAASTRRVLAADALSIPVLTAAKRSAPDASRFRDNVRALTAMSTPAALALLQETGDPLLAWACHIDQTRRGIAPALRLPLRDGGPQMDSITFAADVLWLQRRHPGHAADFKGWRRVLVLPPGSEPWCEAVHGLWAFAYRSGKLAFLTAKGLALSDAQRATLVTMPTKQQAAERRALTGTGFIDLGLKLRVHAAKHPDGSGKHSPPAVAARRAKLWRTHVLAGRSATATAAAWEALTGQRLSRQQVARQIAAVEAVLA